MVANFLSVAAGKVGGVLLSDFDGNKKDLHSVNIEHFCPVNTWIQDPESGWNLIDKTTKDRYCNDSLTTKRLKHLALIVATPIVQAIGQLLNIANRIAKLITLAHFWYPSDQNYSFKARLLEFCYDLLRVVLAPIIYLGLELAAIYGLIRPYDGGKLYATLERASYSSDWNAPCFQPSFTAHFFGGSVTEKDAW